MLGATILGWVVTIKDKDWLISDPAIYLIIIYLLIISSLSLISICLSVKATKKFIYNYNEVNQYLNRISREVKKDPFFTKAVIDYNKMNKKITDNYYFTLINCVDNLIFLMFLFMVVVLIGLFFSIILKYYYYYFAGINGIYLLFGFYLFLLIFSYMIFENK